MQIRTNTANISSKGNVKKQVSNDELRAKIEEKFGKKALLAKKNDKADTVEISDNAQAKNSVTIKEVAGDIDKNDPHSSVTTDKLKQILRTGAFDFSDAERKALKDILMM